MATPSAAEAPALLEQLVSVRLPAVVCLCFGLPFVLQQGITYFQCSWNTDRLIFRWLVVIIVAVTSVYTVVLTTQAALLVRIAITHPNGPSAEPVTSEISWSIVFLRVLLCVEGCTVESYFLWRAVKLAPYRWISGVAVILWAATGLTFAASASAVSVNVVKKGIPFSHLISVLDCAGFWSCLAMNVFTASVIAHGIYFSRKREHRPTNDIVTVWGQGALKTSGVIMISSVGGAISGSFFRTPAEGLVMTFFLHLYVPLATVCCLVSLNSRSELRARFAPSPGAVGPLAQRQEAWSQHWPYTTGSPQLLGLSTLLEAPDREQRV